MCATFCFIFTHWLQKGAAVVFGSTPRAPLLNLEAVIPKGKTGYFHSFALARTGLRAPLAVCGGKKKATCVFAGHCFFGCNSPPCP